MTAPLRSLALLAILLVALLQATPSPAQGTASRLLGTTVSDRQLPSADATTLRSRVVRPDISAVDRLARDHLATGARSRFVLDLFDGVDIAAEVTWAEVRSDGATVFASVPGDELATVVLTQEGGVLVGSVTSSRGHHTIEQAADGLYRVARRAQFPRELPPVPVFAPGRAVEPLAAPDIPFDSARLIDVLIVWTPAARTGAGGVAQIQAIAQASIDAANAVYFNSGVAQRVRLVHMQEVAYAERTLCDDFAGLSGGSRHECALIDATRLADGQMDEVHSLRDAHGADLVAVLVDAPNPCGISWLGNPPTEGSSGFGFSTSHYGCAAASRTVARETAHNMGANHDFHVLGSGACPDGREGGAFCFSRGFVEPVGGWLTLMAVDLCTQVLGIACTRIDFLSNPRLSRNGQALGNSGADNALTLNRTAKTIAGYRPTSALHPIPQRFADVLAQSPFFGSIEFLAQAAITGGCGGGLYCPDAVVTRDQMAAFLMRSTRASNWTPPAPSGLFADVPPNHPFAAHIEALFNAGITKGCGGGLFCPSLPVTRGQMAVFVVKAVCGEAFVPDTPPAQNFFDVPPQHPFYAFIEHMRARGITGGCLTNPPSYCAESNVLRSQMAAFLERGFPFGFPTEACQQLP